MVTIVIAIASLTAISTFGSAAEQANKDALTNDLSTLAASAQDYYFRPETLSGGWRAFDGFTVEGILLPVSGISSDGLFAETENRTLEIVYSAGGALSIIGHLSSCDGYTRGTVKEDGVLSEPGTCSEIDQIPATVGRQEIVFE